jgi:hypothetical protein
MTTEASMQGRTPEELLHGRADAIFGPQVNTLIEQFGPQYTLPDGRQVEITLPDENVPGRVSTIVAVTEVTSRFRLSQKPRTLTRTIVGDAHSNQSGELTKSLEEWEFKAGTWQKAISEANSTLMKIPEWSALLRDITPPVDQ